MMVGNSPSRMTQLRNTLLDDKEEFEKYKRELLTELEWLHDKELSIEDREFSRHLSTLYFGLFHLMCHLDQIEKKTDLILEEVCALKAIAACSKENL